MYEIRVFIAAFVAALIAVCVLPVLVSVNKPPPVEPDTERRFFCLRSSERVSDGDVMKRGTSGALWHISMVSI